MTKSEILKISHKLNKIMLESGWEGSYCALLSFSMKRVHKKERTNPTSFSLFENVLSRLSRYISFVSSNKNTLIKNEGRTVTIIKTKIEKGFTVKFPFELKDAFRAVFKSAKWNACEKVWIVGPRSEKRLDQWIAECQATSVDFEAVKEENDALLISQRELECLKNMLAVVQSRSESLKKQNDEMANSAQVLAGLKIELEAAQLELEEQTKVTESLQLNLKSQFEKVCDLDVILEAQEDMQRAYNKTGSVHRSRFNEAQRIIGVQRDNLENIGLDSWGMMQLACMSFNRPDRDKPGSISLSDILLISKED